MPSQGARAEFASILRNAVHPPIHERRFWLIQAIVVLVAALDFCGAVFAAGPASNAIDGVAISLWIVPVLYSALRYGLVGSAATSALTMMLWMPILALPNGEGMPTCDLASLAVLVVVGFFAGHRIEAERLAHARVERATAERLATETRYRQLFETNSAPILVLDAGLVVRDANPAATTLFGSDVVGNRARPIFDDGLTLDSAAGQVLPLSDGRDYRVDVMPLSKSDVASTQVVLQDVTEERNRGRRATRYAALLVQAEEEQRRHLARELHDEPLQLFLHLGRRLESLGKVAGVPPAVSSGLAKARRQALGAADQLRSLARELRPPALDQLGLVAALSSLLAEVEVEAGLATQLDVSGELIGLEPQVELGAFRIVQEAVCNVRRHARAQRVQVTVEFGIDELSLSVEDDGIGFSVQELDELGSDHLGVLGMRERANLLGGHLELRSEPDGGTLVSATMPFGARQLATLTLQRAT